ncbi:hypothetical protein B0H10DRAFT_2049986 [Mycena sp. CBHHK59/15]|nr:hypothetical protein B0H10DRAFT_2124223 [Mycena sp. CBHHK59/15]KAJ6613113.1 hypothetical protein B0H10DRAFT_2049986 [Mycena sp. CBHHK59/15]
MGRSRHTPRHGRPGGGLCMPWMWSYSSPLDRDSGVDPRSGERAATALHPICLRRATAPASSMGVVRCVDVPTLSLQPNAHAPTRRSGQAWHPSSTAHHPITSNLDIDLCWGCAPAAPTCAILHWRVHLHPAYRVLCGHPQQPMEHTLAHRSRGLILNEPSDLCPGVTPSHMCWHGPDSHWICMQTSDGDCAGVRGWGLALKQLLPV